MAIVDLKLFNFGSIPITDSLLYAAGTIADNYSNTHITLKNYVNAGKSGGKIIEGGDATTETVSLFNNSVDQLGMIIDGDGTLRVNTSNYEALVTDDDDVPNRKFVIDNIPVAVKENITVTSDGQTAFTLSTAVTTAASVRLILNHVVYERLGVDFNVSGTSLTWLDPSDVTLEIGDQFTIMHNDGSAAGPPIQSCITYADSNANYNNRRVRQIGATGAYRLPFHVPKHFTGTLALKLIGYPINGAGGTGKDIDLTGEYTNAAGASATQYTFSDITSTYDTGTDDTRWEQDITSLVPNLAPGSEGAILVDHKGIGGAVNYLGPEVTST